MVMTTFSPSSARRSGSGLICVCPSNLSAVQRKHVLSRYDAGEHTQAELAELFRISRTAVYREIQRRGTTTKPADER